MNLLQKWQPEERWNPFREMDELQRQMAALFGLSKRKHDGEDLELTACDWSPLVDIIEDDKEYLIKAELPEMKKDEVRITTENGVLTIRGERKFEHEEKNQKFHRVERAYGSFTRSFSLPEDTDATKTFAEFKDGVLKVHLPKDEHAKPKALQVKIS